MSGITSPAEVYFKDGLWAWAATVWEKLVSSGGRLFTAQHGWSGSAWQKLPLLWGYSDRWAESLSEEKDGNGNYQKDTGAIGADEVYVLQHISFYNETGDRGMLRIWAMGGTAYLCLVYDPTPVANEIFMWTGELVLKQGDYIRAQQVDCIDNDVINCRVWGYKMKIAE